MLGFHPGLGAASWPQRVSLPWLLPWPECCCLATAPGKDDYRRTAQRKLVQLPRFSEPSSSWAWSDGTLPPLCALLHVSVCRYCTFRTHGLWQCSFCKSVVTRFRLCNAMLRICIGCIHDCPAELQDQGWREFLFQCLLYLAAVLCINADHAPLRPLEKCFKLISKDQLIFS